jgi:hypothetical protein
VNEIDWMDNPLENFSSAIRTQADGTTFHELYLFGDGEAQRLVVGLFAKVEDAYSRLLSEEDLERVETEGEVPLIREGQRTQKALVRFTLRDLPAILDTLVVLEEDHRRREREEAEHKAAERKARESQRASQTQEARRMVVQHEGRRTTTKIGFAPWYAKRA